MISRTKRRECPVACSLVVMIAAGIACCQPATGAVACPDPAKIASIEKANESLAPEKAFENLEVKAGRWQVDSGWLVQSDPAASLARAFVKGHCWTDCTIKAKVRIDAAGGPGPSHGARLIVRGDEKTDTFYTVGLLANSREVRIERSQGLAFQNMTNNQNGALAVASFPVELGKTYELTVVVDHATIYCYIDGKFIVLAQQADFNTQPAGCVGFFTNVATAAFRDVSVKGLNKVTSSPITPFAGNPVNVRIYSPAVIKDDKFRMWDSLLGRYVESVDGISWTWLAGKESVVNQGNKGDWPTGTQCGDPDVLKFDGQYWITYWSTANRRNGGFDGMGIKRSKDGIHWTPEPKNPVFYMGPLGDWDEMVVGDHAMIRDGDRFKLWHVGITRWQHGYRNEFGYAESPDGLQWRKCRLNPVLTQGRPGTWDGGWIYAAGIVKIDDEQTETHVYKGKPGASYHLFYTGQPTNNELICGVKRIGYAFSLDGIHWVKWNDPNTAEPFQDSDPVISWAEYGKRGFTGVGAATAMLLGDEVRVYYTMYEDRIEAGKVPEGPVDTAFATVKVDVLRKIVADAKAKGLLQCASRKEIDAVLDAPLPQSMWHDLQGHVLAAVKAKQAGDATRNDAAMATIAATRSQFTRALNAYYANEFAALKKIIDQLDSGRTVTEKLLLELGAQQIKKAPPQVEWTGLNIASQGQPIMIEMEATCSRFDVGYVRWSTGDKNVPPKSMEFIAGYPSEKTPTYRVTFLPGGKPITSLHIQFPAGAVVDLKRIRVHELKTQ